MQRRIGRFAVVATMVGVMVGACSSPSVPGGGAPGGGTVDHFDIATDFGANVAVNPSANGAWSAMYSNLAGTDVQPLTTYAGDGHWCTAPGCPGVHAWVTPLNGGVVVHPTQPDGVGGAVAVTFRAQRAGTAALTWTFEDLALGGSPGDDGGVLTDVREQTSSGMHDLTGWTEVNLEPGHTASLTSSATVHVEAGDMVHFIVHPELNSSFDTTLVRAAVTVTG